MSNRIPNLVDIVYNNRTHFPEMPHSCVSTSEPKTFYMPHSPAIYDKLGQNLLDYTRNVAIFTNDTWISLDSLSWKDNFKEEMDNFLSLVPHYPEYSVSKTFSSRSREGCDIFTGFSFFGSYVIYVENSPISFKLDWNNCYFTPIHSKENVKAIKDILTKVCKDLEKRNIVDNNVFNNYDKEGHYQITGLDIIQEYYNTPESLLPVTYGYPSSKLHLVWNFNQAVRGVSDLQLSIDGKFKYPKSSFNFNLDKLFISTEKGSISFTQIEQMFARMNDSVEVSFVLVSYLNKIVKVLNSSKKVVLTSKFKSLKSKENCLFYCTRVSTPASYTAISKGLSKMLFL